MLLGALALSLLAVWPEAGRAAEWGGIEPGVTTAEQLRERYGPPTKETRRKVEGYDTFEWLFEGRQAPVGFIRMTVDFGILMPSGYSPSVVRVLRLDPKPFIFGRDTILDGWGQPDQVGAKDEREMFVYRSGLVVIFDPSGTLATSLYFSVKQPDQPAAAPAPSAAPPSPSPAPAAPRPPPVRR
ncbi:MAG: hypothetical protein A2X52_14395 [Candidatus Rokubacteria bacterium GWC2_70_16]|nr:MAG: hypothetical protein A2X52_14395 [Candidatus Rokubacteria bacterium GWC2_70_16]